MQTKWKEMVGEREENKRKERENVTVAVNQSIDRRQESVNRCWEVAAVASDSIFPCCGPTNIKMYKQPNGRQMPKVFSAERIKRRIDATERAGLTMDKLRVEFSVT